MTNPEPFSQYQCLGLAARSCTSSARAPSGSRRADRHALQEAGSPAGGLYAPAGGSNPYGVMRRATSTGVAAGGAEGSRDYGWGTLT
jgi:hypothetical protein